MDAHGPQRVAARQPTLQRDFTVVTDGQARASKIRLKAYPVPVFVPAKQFNNVHAGRV